jgi:PAS domain-containing protein
MQRGVFTPVSAAFESLGMAVALLDSNMCIIDASPASRGLLGTPDLAGHKICEFVDVDPIADRLTSGHRISALCRMSSGSPASVNVMAAPLPEGAFDNGVRYLIALELMEPSSRYAAVEEAERIRRALEDHRWRRTAAARALGISRATLWRRMREHGLL